MINNLNTGAAKAFNQYGEDQTAYLERKMKHYNDWLRGEKKPGEIYPGFPEDEKLLQEIHDLGVDIDPDSY